MDCMKEFIDNHKVGIAVGVTAVVGFFVIKWIVRGRRCHSKAKLTGKTALVTGCNTGLGKETARDFARRGARVLLACRDVSKAENAAKDIRESTGNQNVAVYKLDLASLESVRNCAAEINKKESRLHILVNNGAVMWTPYSKTADGFELQFGTNHLGHFLLTNLLLDLMKKSAPSRIVTVSSLGHTFLSEVDFDNLNGEKSYHPIMAYSLSKIANILFSQELGQRLKGTGVTSNSLHPGAVSTELARHIDSSEHNFFFRWGMHILYYYLGVKYLSKSPLEGAQTSIYVAVSEELENVTGKYFSDCALKEPSACAQNDENAKKMWDISVKMTGLK